MRGSKKKSKKRRSKDAKKSAKKKGSSKNGGGDASLLHQMQISSGGTASEATVAALKWEKLSPGEFETLQEYIQCKFPHFLLFTHCP